MTQAPQEGKGQFVQFPFHLIYGCPGLTRDDKWVLLSIMGRYWNTGPHRLSYREVAAISGVPVSLLSSFVDKKTGKPHEGILDRIVRVTGYLCLEIRKAINPITRQPCKQPQTYISINYPRIWQDNAAYCESCKSVSYTNTSYEESVSYTNTTASPVNTSVSHTNGSVSYTNKSVSVSRSKQPPIDSIDYLDITDTEKSNCDDAIAHHALAPLSSLQETESENADALPPALVADASLVDRIRRTGSGDIVAGPQWTPELAPDDELSTIDVDNCEDGGDDAPTLYRLPAIRPTTSTIPVTQAKGDDDAPAPSDLAIRSASPGAVGTAQPVLPTGAPELLSAALPHGKRAREATMRPVTDTFPSGSAVPPELPDVAASTPTGASGSIQSVPAMPPVLGPGANANTSPPHPDKRDTNPTLPAVRRTRTRKPPKEEPPLLCETAKVRKAIIAFRGFALEDRDAIINENKGIKAWCEAHTEDELEYVMELLPKDSFWGQQSKREFFRVKHFIDKASALLAKRLTTESMGSDWPPFMRPDGSMSDYAAYAIWKATHPEPIEAYYPAVAEGV